jgi:plasmid stabilization system protein ParE
VTAGALRVGFTEDARAQLAAIKMWWQANRHGAPDLFADELEHALAELSELPHMGAASADARLPGVRRLLLSRTQYHVYYRVADDSLTVLAVWHTKRGRPPRL